MKILRVIVTMDPSYGGPCQGIRNSIPPLEDLGIANEVVCFDAPDSLYLGTDTFKIHAIGPAKGPYSYCSGFEGWLQQHFERFDAVIIHGLWQYTSYGTYRVWKQYKKNHTVYPQLYVMPHGMLDPYFQKAPERRLKALRNRIFWHILEKRVIHGVDGLLFTCEQELLLARTTFGAYCPQKELNVGYGINEPPPVKETELNVFKAAFPRLQETPYFLFLSRIDPKKGVDLLLEAYIEKRLEYSNIPDLVVAGPGMDSLYGKKLLALAQGSSHIHFTGMVTGAVKWAFFEQCEAFVLPSHQENFGIAVAEALACSVPVLISDQVNIWKEIESMKAGLICTDKLKGVSEMLDRWIALGPDEKKHMKRNARCAYETYFTNLNFAKKIKESIFN
ncbi:glycosyltransferase [Leeuwenhoekiella sp. LLG6367-2.1]|uniref:glycosyltransferase n=1 Tax=Leeuwenhoekiella sp. LLG6367-2.1 TaxID=3160833 RepID=UPI00386F4C4A